MSITSENTFETALVQSLVEQGNYTEAECDRTQPTSQVLFT